MKRIANTQNMTKNSHVHWLTDWRKVRNGPTQTPDGSPEEQEHFDAAEGLSLLLATTPTISPESPIGQIAWFKQDLGQRAIVTGADPGTGTVLRSWTPSQAR